jgi:hypothetical protein
MTNRYVLKLDMDKIQDIRAAYGLKTKHYFVSMFAEYGATPSTMMFGVDANKAGLSTVNFIFPNQRSLDIARSLVKEYEADDFEAGVDRLWNEIVTQAKEEYNV